MNLNEARAGLSALIHIRDNGNQSQWVQTLIQQYEEEITRLMLLDGQPDPSVLDADGLLTYSEVLKRTESEDEGI
ncbi:hypothetical protein AS026_19465 [Rhizobium altiplani]|uniref:Uncharacterized protein n=1 Tax=Rhizobium altiplani TaxID=1864509 RepID=A0A120FG54_9HYPH|nr:hypothetical protein [Rhizobium altiplani]KWV43851.1 hypothetical protein AS026_19465 [Rhizobium altiplani]